MTDIAIATILILAVFLAGALRALLDKRIWIFILSTCASIVLSVAVALDHFGLFTPLVEYMLFVSLMLLGAALEAFCKLSEKFNYKGLINDRAQR